MSDPAEVVRRYFEIGEGAGSLAPGMELVAHIAAWLTVADGRLREHETFDCYEAPPSAAPGRG